MKGWDVPERDPRKGGNNLLIVDGMNLSFRYKHTGSTKFAADYIKTVNSLAKSYSCADKIVLSDRGGSKYRKEIYPKYKANRDYSDQTEEEKARTEAFFDEYNRTLELINETPGMESFWHKGIEADDFMSVIVDELLPHYDNIWLISTDMDWDEKLSPKVHRFSYASRKEFFFNDGGDGCNFFEHHGCDNPQQFVMMKCLRGDQSDNIRGVEGVGIKRAYGILRGYEDTFAIIDSLPLPGKQKYIQNLNASAELLELNIQLMDLNSFAGEIIQTTDPEASERLMELLSRYPMGGVAEILDEFDGDEPVHELL